MARESERHADQRSPGPNTRDFRYLKHSGALWSWCPVSVLEPVSVMAAVMCGHGFCPRVAAGVSRGSTARRAGRFLLPGGFRFLRSLQVPLAPGDVEDVQGGAGGGVRRGGERVQ